MSVRAILARSKNLTRFTFLDPGSLFLRNKSYWINKRPSKSVQVSSTKSERPNLEATETHFDLHWAANDNIFTRTICHYCILIPKRPFILVDNVVSNLAINSGQMRVDFHGKNHHFVVLPKQIHWWRYLHLLIISVGIQTQITQRDKLATTLRETHSS